MESRSVGLIQTGSGLQGWHEKMCALSNTSNLLFQHTPIAYVQLLHFQTSEIRTHDSAGQVATGRKVGSAS